MNEGTKVGQGTPRTLGDIVRQHAALPDCGGTGQGLELLDLKGSRHYGAANLYLAALAVIRESQAELAACREQRDAVADALRWLVDVVDERGLQYISRSSAWMHKSRAALASLTATTAAKGGEKP